MEKLPTHVTIIMDGNGRWAKLHGKERIYGHYEGAESVRACCEYAVERGIKYLSLFAFSTENWNRPDAEVSSLMNLMMKSMIEEYETFQQNKIRLRVIGDRANLSEELVGCIADVEARTASNTSMTLIIMLNYSGKWDILQAAQRYAEDVKKGLADESLTPEIYGRYLSTSGIPDPDLMIRTSGEQRISNYMLWQCAYTEFYFTEVLWPDFRKEQFAEALKAFSSRDRRYGNVK